jgi:hypothetical protein
MIYIIQWASIASDIVSPGPSLQLGVQASQTFSSTIRALQDAVRTTIASGEPIYVHV